MTNEQKYSKEQFLQFLGLSQRAGQLLTGEERVTKAIQNGEVKLLILANDLGPSTNKKMTNKCTSYEVPLINTYTKQELGQAIGQPRAVIAVLDNGFAKKMIIMNN